MFTHYTVAPLWMVSVRMSLGAVLMIAVAVAFAWRAGNTKRILTPMKNGRAAARVVAFALLGLGFTQLTYLESINSSNAGTATVLEYIGPVLIVALVCVRERRAPHAREICAVACVVAGTFFLATHGDPTQLVLSPQALFWGLLSAISMIFYTLIPEPLMKTYDNFSVLAWAMLIGGVLMLAVVRPWTVPVDIDAVGWLALVGGLIVLGTVGAFILYFQGIKDAGPSRASMLASVEVVSATLLSVLWLGTPFTLMDLVGLLLIMSTVFLLAKRDEQTTQPI